MLPLLDFERSELAWFDLENLGQGVDYLSSFRVRMVSGVERTHALAESDRREAILKAGF